MKVAIIHDSLTEFGGAERVVSELFKIFPQAHLFTSYFYPEIHQKYFPFLEKDQNFFLSWYQIFPHKTNTTTQLLSPLIWQFFKLKEYDLVITSSAYFLPSLATIGLKNVVHYLHSLPKNLFDLEEKTFWQKRLSFKYQKSLFIKSLSPPAHLLTNSKNTQKIVREKTGLNSTVIYPPVTIPSNPFKKEKGDYFLIISRLDESKGIELAVKTCTKLSIPLKIAGKTNNPEYLKQLKKSAGPTVEFLGFVSDQERKNIYQKAKAFLFCSKNEDFGIAPVEAMAYGVPVIAYWGGGAKETIIENKTGVFFRNYSWSSLAKAIEQSQKIKFITEDLYKQAKRFDRMVFREQLTKHFNDTFKMNLPL